MYSGGYRLGMNQRYWEQWRGWNICANMVNRRIRSVSKKPSQQGTTKLFDSYLVIKDHLA